MPAKILVVDDEAHLRRVVSLYLRARNYEVDTAENGLDAIHKIATDRPDVIVADIGMPGMDGFELCSRLRRDAATKTIPFIFLTAKDQDTDRIKARKVGSDDYLTKPCPLEQLAERVDTIIDRIEQARKIPLDRIGVSGQLEDVDVLDMIQMLELSQKTGALVLSHGERTGTLYFRDGVIVDADIRSPKRQEPLFVLLGWTAGRYLFLPDALPERMPITASLANLLIEDLRKLERHQEPVTVPGGDEPAPAPAGTAAVQVIARLEAIARRLAPPPSPADQQVLRILVAGTTGSGKSELIQFLVHDLSASRWAATGVEGHRHEDRTDFGLVRLSPDVVLHLVSVRAEKRFRSLWEQCLPNAVGMIVLVGPDVQDDSSHLHTFLKARQSLAPALPVSAIGTLRTPPALPGLAPSDYSMGSIEDRTVRLTALERLLG
jgi:DNA-binding response OmpR family regulator